MTVFPQNVNCVRFYKGLDRPPASIRQWLAAVRCISMNDDSSCIIPRSWLRYWSALVITITLLPAQSAANTAKLYELYDRLSGIMSTMSSSNIMHLA